MYHVTNVSVDKSPKPPEWNMIKPSVANDPVYNGNLLGLPVAFFTTTLFNSELPKISPYPRGGTKGTHHWRVTIPFDYCKFKIFLMNKYKTDKSGVTQVHLLCLNEENSEADKLLITVLTHKGILIDTTEYFPEKTAADELEQGCTVVNVSFINPVLIGEDAKWDTVSKRYNNPTNALSGTLYYWGIVQLKTLQKEPGMDQMESLQQEWEVLNGKGKLNQDTAINTK